MISPSRPLGGSDAEILMKMSCSVRRLHTSVSWLLIKYPFVFLSHSPSTSFILSLSLSLLLSQSCSLYPCLACEGAHPALSLCPTFLSSLFLLFLSFFLSLFLSAPLAL